MTLMVILMMFPQFVETIYSPALPSISKHFNVSPEKTYLTISFYFIAFAFGVIFWGIISDYIGRRKAMLCGLGVYAIASMIALIAPTFEVILIARFIAAFGIAVGSVVTQTMMRDCYTGQELNKVFSIMGIALSISPVLGLLLGGITADTLEYFGIFSLLAILSLMLLMISFYKLPETKKDDKTVSFASISKLASQLYRDANIWRYALLIMSFNVLLFSYYTYAPFLFEKAGFDSTIYGYSGIILALGSFIGSYINKFCITKGVQPLNLIKTAVLLAAISAFVNYFVNNSLYFLLPTLFIVTAYGIAIPNLLSLSLLKYKVSIGTAGALFGLLYYLLIGIGLFVSSLLNDYSIVLVSFSIVMVVTYFSYSFKRNFVD